MLKSVFSGPSLAGCLGVNVTITEVRQPQPVYEIWNGLLFDKKSFWLNVGWLKV